jgi:aspartyl-tRNA(Asn)/glutamyl-tRNA(Gln) amidotransferase subunit A
VPYGAKDLLAARGAPTTFSSGAYADQVLDFDAAAIDRLRRSGAVLAAKLAMMELAGFHSGSTSASLHGPGLNPWDPSRWAAGSSSGSGAAVAAGLVPFALGSETGGSIGSPSAFCGVTGLRPTFGLVSRFGAMELVGSLDKVGPMAHSVTDCATVLEVLAGHDRRDPDSVARRRFHRRDVDRVRTGRRRPWRLAYAPTDIEAAVEPIRPALQDARRVFEHAGVEFVEAELPADIPYLQVILDVLAGEGGANFADLIESDRFGLIVDPDQRARMQETLQTSARTYLEAMRMRRRIREAFQRVFRDADAILTHTLPWEPTPIGEKLEAVPIGGGFTGMVSASNLAELPALFVPAGLSRNALPVGIQIVGPPFSEAMLVALGELFQERTSWHRLRPPMSGSQAA